MNRSINKVAFHTLGCKVNQYETDAMQQMFEEKGYLTVSFNEVADIYIINTCTVTNVADRKSRQMIHRAKKMNPEAITVAVGCYVQAAKEKLEQDENIDIVIGNNKKQEIVEIVHNYINENKSMDYVIDIAHTNEYEPLYISKVSENTRAYIKIQDGCNQFCSYCIIPYARGRVRSREKQDVIKEVNNLVQNGYKEIVLTGIHLASYGMDLENVTLLSLTEELNTIEGLERIRFGSLEPTIITEDFANRLSKLDKICPHFHLSLQSGCNETLKRMNRKYTTELYYDKCQILREYFDNPAITTDIIVGFPGETEEEFQITYDFLKKVAFADMHIFKYSVREGTRAATMENQVSESIKNDRSSVLIQLAEELSSEYKQSFINTVEEVLFEEMTKVNNVEYAIGHNKRYIKIGVPTNENLTNKIFNVELIERSKEIVIGKIVNNS